jgi:hypothetical protein
MLSSAYLVLPAEDSSRSIEYSMSLRSVKVLKSPKVGGNRIGQQQSQL